MPVQLPSCVTLPQGNNPPCITFPGGAKLCPMWDGNGPPTDFEIVRRLLGQINTALAPMQPIFTLLEMMAALVAVIKALPKLDVKTLKKKVPLVVQLGLQLLKLLPQASIPYMIVDIIDAFILFVASYVQTLGTISNRIQSIIAAESYYSAADGVSALAEAIACGRDDLELYLANAAAGMAPVNSLISAINTLFEVIGLGKFTLPEIAGADFDTIDDTISVLESFVEILVRIRSLIPLP